MGFLGGLGPTCQLPLLRAHFACGQDHGDAAEVAVGDAHEEGEDAGPGGVAEGGLPIGVNTHDEEGDEDHTEAGVDEEVGPSPVVGQGSQDLQRGAETLLGGMRRLGRALRCPKWGKKEMKCCGNPTSAVLVSTSLALVRAPWVEMTLGGAKWLKKRTPKEDRPSLCWLWPLSYLANEVREVEDGHDEDGEPFPQCAVVDL